MSERSELNKVGVTVFRFVVVVCTGMLTSMACTASQESSGPERRERAAMRELGLRHKTAWDLYQALREGAAGGKRLAPNELPDWTGLWVWNSNRGFLFDPDTPPGVVTT